MSYQLKKVFRVAVAALAGLFVWTGVGFAQNRTITGTVTDDFGEPLIGASVTVEGNATVGAITDLDGHYSLAVPEDATALRFSFIGQEDVVEQIGSRTVVNAVLASSSIALNATVVTAMGIRKEEKSLSYNVQQARLDAVSPTGSFVNSLNGKVAGVAINQSSAGVGGASRVVMRGSKSISGNNNALYVIDGIPMQNNGGSQPGDVFSGAGQTGDILGLVNADDIESISVLSGPSAAALYGANAANGVIIINTKKGSANSVNINYSNSTEFSRAYIMPEFQNVYRATTSDGIEAWGEKMATPSTLDRSRFFQTGYNTVNNLSFSGGNEKNQTYASVSTTNARGIIHNNNVDKYNFNVRNTTNFLKDMLTLDVAATYARVNEQNMISQGQYHNPVLSLYLLPADASWEAISIYERYDANRGIKTQYWPYGSLFSMQNPFWITEKEKFNNQKDRFTGTAQLRFAPFKWLNVSARAKIDRTDNIYEQRIAAGSNSLFASKYGHYGKTEDNTEQKYAEVMVNVNKYFLNDMLNVTAVVGANIDDIQYNWEEFSGHLADIANLYTFANVNKNDNFKYSQNGFHSQQQSIFGNAQVGFKSMVYLDATLRSDWSSTLYTAGGIFYPTVGLSAILTEIVPVLKTKDILSYWKIRGSYSEVGNSPDPALHLLNPTYPVSGGAASTSTRRPNTDLKPENTKSFELGTNIHFFKGALQIDATWYKSSTFNQFFQPQISTASGNTSMYVNGGQVDNTGIELSARFGKTWGKLHFDTYATYTHNENKIVKLLDWDDPQTGQHILIDKLEMGGFGGVDNVLYPGGTLSDIYVSTIKQDSAGCYLLNDSDNVQVDETADGRILAGHTDPDHQISWGSNLSFYGVNLGFLFTARFGGVVVSKTQAIMDYFGASQSSADFRDAHPGFVELNGLRQTEVKTFYPTIAGGTGNGAMSQYVYSADNIRLAEVSLGYDIPVNNWVKWIKGVNVSVVGHNLLMIYKKAPFDPELTSSTGTYRQGVDYFMQPNTRSIGFSVKVKL